MANTRGFEVVAQVTVGVLRQILHDAWKNGGDGSGAGVIPQKRTIAPGLMFGPYLIADGEITVPESGLALDMDTEINGVAVTLGLIVDIEIDNPPIPSATLFNMTADVTIHAPVAVVEPATNKIGVVLAGLPAGAVTASLTSGNPIAPITAAAIAEYVHAQYQDPASPFPRLIENVPIAFPPFTMTADLEIFDDEANPARRITVDGPNAGKVTLKLPCRIRFYDITGDYAGITLDSPMAVDAVIHFVCNYEENADRVVARVATGTATLEDIVPAAGVEGANYSSNKSLVGLYPPQNAERLPELIKTQFSALAQPRLQSIGDIEVVVPRVSDIEAFIVEQLRQELDARGHVAVWKPEAPEGSDITIENVAPKALSDAMAICINAGETTSIDALTTLIPAGKDFCVAVSARRVRSAINAAVDSEFPNGFPHRYNNIEGYDADLESLDISLRDDDRIRMTGDVTVIDAIADKIDVGASFEAHVDLKWVDGDDGEGQKIVPFMEGEPDISMSAWAWIVSFIIGFILAGIIGVIVVAVVLVIVESIATRIGGAVIRDEVSNQFKGISAWPQTLDGIGTISARFDEPVDIDTGGILSTGTMVLTATYALTAVDQADAHGPYSGLGGQPINFDGGLDLAVSAPGWLLGDGKSSALRRTSHTYGDSGLYVSKLRIAVGEDGGATTRNLVAARIANVPAVVTLGPDIVVKEGEEFDITARFEDAEWLDRHRAVFDFGDNSKPVHVAVTETNDPPAAKGQATARHAYCNNGEYRITARIIDEDGGVGEAALTARVENVPPKVFLPEKLCVLAGQPVRLSGRFEDGGWCDTHRGLWHFGDCASQAAIIAETHKPPKGEGTAEAVHVYDRCGVHVARLVITDSDGASGEAAMQVHATELHNRRFEDGFHRREAAGAEPVEVANHWRPFEAPWPTIDKAGSAAPRRARFAADARAERDGQRAQLVEIGGAVIAGIVQTLCVNRDWAYELEARFNLPLRSGGVAMIGIDPTGGDDPLSAHVIWIEASPGDDWQTAAVRATAEEEELSVYLGIAARTAGSNTIRWDSAHLAMIQPWCPEQRCVSRRVTFDTLKDRQLAGPTPVDGIVVEPLGSPSEVLDHPGGRAICLRKGGLRLNFGPVDEVTLVLLAPADTTIEVKLYSAAGLVRQLVEALPGGERTLVLREAGLTRIDLRSAGRGICLLAISGCLPRLEAEPAPRTLCLDFTDLDPKFETRQPFERKGFTIAPRKRPLRIVEWGDPQGVRKLAFPEEGLAIAFPFAAARAVIKVNAYAGKGILVAAFAGEERVALIEEPVHDAAARIVVERPGMTRIEISGGGNEGALIELCITDRIASGPPPQFAPASQLTTSARKALHHGRR